MKAIVKSKNAASKTRGKLVRRGGLLVWTGKVPPIPPDEAVKQSRLRRIKDNA